MNRVQQRASLHEKAVQAVAEGSVKVPRQRRSPERRTSKVERARLHPALLMARALGIDPARVEVTAPPPLWGCVIHNNTDWRIQ